MKRIVIDIGELGWSLYLVAHTRWLLLEQNDEIVVATYPDRRCLYQDITDTFIDLPYDFDEKFGQFSQDCLGFHGLSHKFIYEYIKQIIPDGYVLLDGWSFSSCKHFYKGRTIYKKFEPTIASLEKNSILIFPRRRHYSHHAFRNLPEEFYIKLTERLCDEFNNLVVMAIGTPKGAYAYSVDRSNFISRIGEHNLQDLIDICETAVCAIGGTSAPPKITLLQGVPTFIIGHEYERFVHEDNWMKTRVGFFQIAKESYSDFIGLGCINEIVNFIGEQCSYPLA